MDDNRDVKKEGKAHMMDLLTKEFMRSIVVIDEAETPFDMLKSLLARNFGMVRLITEALLIFGAKEDNMRTVLDSCIETAFNDALEKAKNFTEKNGTFEQVCMVDNLMRNVEEHLTASQKAAENKAP